MKKKKLKRKIKDLERAVYEAQRDAMQKRNERNIDWRDRFEIAAAARDDIATRFHLLDLQHTNLLKKHAGIKQYRVTCGPIKSPVRTFESEGKSAKEAILHAIRNEPSEWVDVSKMTFRGFKLRARLIPDKE